MFARKSGRQRRRLGSRLSYFIYNKIMLLFPLWDFKFETLQSILRDAEMHKTDAQPSIAFFLFNLNRWLYVGRRQSGSFATSLHLQMLNMTYTKR